MTNECEHEVCSLERVKEIEYECEEQIKVLMEEVCNECGEKLGEEIHVFKFAYIETVAGG